MLEGVCGKLWLGKDTGQPLIIHQIKDAGDIVRRYFAGVTTDERLHIHVVTSPEVSKGIVEGDDHAALGGYAGESV